jgi:hypothetical protein
VPASFPLKLNTSSFRLLIPALFNKYPNMGFNVVVDAVGNPLTLTVSPSLLSLRLDSPLKAYISINPSRDCIS